MFNSNNYLTDAGEYQAGIQERHNAYEGLVTRIQSRAQQSKNRRIASLGLAAQSEGNKMLESIGMAEAAPAVKSFVGNSIGKVLNPHLKPVVESVSRGARGLASEFQGATTELAQTGRAMAEDTAAGARTAAGDMATGVRAAGRKALAAMRGGVSEGEGTEMEGSRLTGVRFGNPLTSGQSGMATEYAGAGRGVGGGGAPRGLTTSDYAGSGKPMAEADATNMENSAGGMTTKYTAADRASQDAAEQFGGGTQDTTAAARSRTLSKAGAKAGVGDDVATPAATDATEETGLATTEDTLGEVAATNIEDPIGWLAGIAAGVVGIVGAITGAAKEKADEAKSAVIANAPAPTAPPPMSSAGVGAVSSQSSALSRTY